MHSQEGVDQRLGANKGLASCGLNARGDYVSVAVGLWLLARLLRASLLLNV